MKELHSAGLLVRVSSFAHSSVIHFYRNFSRLFDENKKTLNKNGVYYAIAVPFPTIQRAQLVEFMYKR